MNNIEARIVGAGSPMAGLITAKELRDRGWNWSMIELLPEPDEIVRIGRNRVPGHAWKPESIQAVHADPDWQRHAVKAGVIPLSCSTT
jgi:2-polyprenyl-6-methoxyphenol hydroxylase-like FAD-dependent oxidoreductase